MKFNKISKTMKNKIRVLLAGLTFLLFSGLCAQNPCPELQVLLKKADSLLAGEQYQASIGKLTIARDRCPERSREVDSLILVVFTAIENKRKEAEWAKQEAVKAHEKARIKQQEAEEARAFAEKLLTSLRAANENLQQSAARTDKLQRDLADGNPQQYIWQRASEAFRFDPRLIRRNYQDALTYFALTNFLNSSPLVEQFVRSCQLGNLADAAFRAGELDMAETYYHEVLNILEATDQDTEYEQLRLRHIEEVRRMEAVYRDSLPAAPTELFLSGNWWTIPKSFYALQSVTRLTLHQNPAVREEWPFLSQGFAHLQSVRLLDCPNLTLLQDWSALPELKILEIHDNADLEMLDHLDQLQQLSALHITGNERLKSVSGLQNLHNLKTLEVSKNKNLDAVGDLSMVKGLERLSVTDVESQKKLDLSGFRDMEVLHIDRWPGLWRISGLENMPRLKSLTISHTAVSPDIGRLSGMPALEELALTGNDSLISLANLDNLPSLQKITIDSNYYLAHLPRWRRFPQLREISMLDNVHVRRFGSLYPLKKLKKADIKGNKHFLMTSVGLAPGWIWGGYHAGKDAEETYFNSPALTFSASVKMLQLAVQAEYTVFNRNYFPSAPYPLADRCACEDFFESIRAIDRFKYKERVICNVDKNRFRLLLKYDVYPFFPIGPIYYIGLGVTMMDWNKYAPVIAGGAQFPLRYNYISLDWRLDFAELYRPFDRILVQSFSVGYNVRLGYKRSWFRESHARKEASFRPKRLF